MKSKSHLVTNLGKRASMLEMMLPLLILVTTSLSFAILTVYDLEWEEHISNRKGVFLFIYGLVFFSCLYQAINTIFLHSKAGQHIIKTYKLTKSDVLDISNKQVSAVQALFCCVTGVTSVLYSCTRDMLHTSHYISEAYAWFGAAYFLYDIWSMYKVSSAKSASLHMNGDAKVKISSITKFMKYVMENAIIVGHHIFIGGFGFLVITHLRGGLGDCFFGFVYLMEASTPFVSVRGILSKIGMKSSVLYVVNGLVMLATFFFCRVAMFPYVLYMYSKSIQTNFFTAVASLPKGCLISIAILLLPQIYWFYLMLRGATKVLTQKTAANGTIAKNK